MKKIAVILVVVSVVLFGYWRLQGGKRPSPAKIEGLPWQIDSLADGASRVFGISPGRTTLGEVKKLMGSGAVLAIIGTSKTDYGLEMYASHYQAGILKGKLVIVSGLDRASLDAMLQRAVRQGVSRRFLLQVDDIPVALQSRVKSITFIPAVNLDEGIVRRRFGTPVRIVSTGDTVKHFLYPDKGLDVIINDRGKEVLQYVAPRDFSILMDPLIKTTRDIIPG